MIDLVYLFSIYSVLGWIVEVIFFYCKSGKIQKRGILYGAYCPLYGFSITVCTALTKNIINNLFFAFLICAFICTSFELITAILFDKILKHKMWDYTNMKYHLNGYICLSFSLIWGIVSLLCIKIINPILLEADNIKYIAGISIIIFMFIDLFSFIDKTKTHRNHF